MTKTAGNQPLLKRYHANPIIPRNHIPCSNSILNSAVVKFGDEYRGIFRVDHLDRDMYLHAGKSKDGINWEIEPKEIDWVCNNPAIANIEYQYDPRITYLDGRYYIMWCHGYHAYCIGLGVTDDFETFEFLEIALPAYNRNAVLFPRKINGEYCMLHRPSDLGHTAYGDIWLSYSPDLKYWGKHRFVMAPDGWWQGTKIGPGPVPIETPEGWVMIYHGCLKSCNGFVYHAGCAILDLDDPSKVLHRTSDYILAPTEIYEQVGDVPNVVFPCAAVHNEDTDELRVYYGAADTCVCMATTTLRELVEYTIEHDMLAGK